MSKFTLKYHNRYEIISINESFASFNSFKGFNRYESKIDYTRKINTGFSLNFLIFSINAENKYKQTFSFSSTESEAYVFGEAKVKYIYDKYDLNLNSYIVKDIRSNYLSSIFLEDLYYGSVDELIRKYGEFVLTKFLSGGLATALYKASTGVNSTSTETTIENEFTSKISATIKKTPSTKSSSSSEVTFSDISCSYMTQGGNLKLNNFSHNVDINSYSIDLSGWSQSLDNSENSNNLAIAELCDDGFIPLSHFIEEENLQNTLKEYYATGDRPNIKILQEPCIHIKKHLYKPLILWDAELLTRYGDKIQLMKHCIFLDPNGTTNIEDYIESLKVQYPNLKIVIDKYQSNEVIGNEKIAGITFPHYFYSNLFSSEHMTKLVDPVTGKIYLLRKNYTENDKSVAYTIYNEYIINDYTLNDEISNIPIETTLTLSQVRDRFKLIAL